MEQREIDPGQEAVPFRKVLVSGKRDRSIETAPLGTATVAELRAVANRIGGDDGVRKRGLLRLACERALTDADALVAYHDVLLFILAYPEDAAMRRTALRELARVADAARNIAVAGPARSRATLRGSGIAWSEITIAFSHAIAQWAAARYPGAIEIDSFGERAGLLAEWLRHGLPPLEFELVASGEDAPERLVDEAVGGWRRSRLAWLLAQLERLRCDGALRETLFDSLELFLTLRPHDLPISRTFARGLRAPPFYHRAPLLRAVDLASAMAQPLPPERRLSQRERMQLVDAARGVLATLGRETDPIAHADAKRVRYVPMTRGLAIALYSAAPPWRNPLDSHIGYLLFKNAVPIAYGGGWPFLGTCKIGINIFAAFRGGESACAMAAVLRVYAQMFAVERFVVEPYQFGAGNREGLESGAFWFYYRLGFRPVDARARALAAEAFERMRQNRADRTPLSTLLRLTRSDLELAVVPDAKPACDPADLSRATTTWIGTKFRGDRARAEAFAMRRVAAALRVARRRGFNDAEDAALRALAPLLAQIDDLAAWPSRDKARLVAMIRAKGGDEYRYFELMAGFKRLRASLDAIAASAG